jgi:polyphosphate kinase 2 (PPK2 family)
MFEKIDLTQKLSREEYAERMPELQKQLHLLQRRCRRAKLASIIVFEGWSACGKGRVINRLTERLEPRGFTLHNIVAPRTHEKRMPWLCRFWSKIPNWGEMAIFDGSWYRRVLLEELEKELTDAEYQRAFNDIRSFESALADDRYLIVKFFLHIDKSTQKKRLKKLASDPLMEWRVKEKDWRQHRKYDKYLLAIEDMIRFTDAGQAPWVIIEARNQRWARVKVLQTLTVHLERGLQQIESRNNNESESNASQSRSQ